MGPAEGPEGVSWLWFLPARAGPAPGRYRDCLVVTQKVVSNAEGRLAAGDPAKLMVITAGGYAYERPDGVCVVPITALGP